MEKLYSAKDLVADTELYDTRELYSILSGKGILIYDAELKIMVADADIKKYTKVVKRTGLNYNQTAFCTSYQLYWTEEGRAFIREVIKNNLVFKHLPKQQIQRKTNMIKNMARCAKKIRCW